MAKYAHLVATHRMTFIPFPMSTFGALSPQAANFVDTAAEFYSAHQHADTGVCRFQLLQRLQVFMLQEVGKRLVAGVHAAIDCE